MDEARKRYAQQWESDTRENIVCDYTHEFQGLANSSMAIEDRMLFAGDGGYSINWKGA